MATIHLINGTQLERAKICELCPTKPKIWPEDKFYAHLKEFHDPNQSRKCWKCGQSKAGREFRNLIINTCNSCLAKRSKTSFMLGKNRHRIGKRSQ